MWRMTPLAGQLKMTNYVELGWCGLKLQVLMFYVKFLWCYVKLKILMFYVKLLWRGLNLMLSFGGVVRSCKS